MESETTEEELAFEPEIGEEDVMEPEVVTTTDFPVPVIYAEDPEPSSKLKKRGTISLRHRMLAEMAARSFPVSIIAQELHMTEQRVYKLLETNEDIWAEINRVIDSIFADGDRMLANLRMKALIKLDEQLNSSDEDVKEKAIAKVLKITDDKSGSRTAVFIGSGGKSEQGIESVDDMILRMRKERGLPMPVIKKEGE